MSISEAFCTFIDGELYLKNANISEILSDYTHKSNQDRKILLKRRELSRLQKELIKGLTIVPYRVFLNEKGLIKVEIALAKGKNLYDKRETMKKRDIDREINQNS
jgi:SsrA-binding protein